MPDSTQPNRRRFLENSVAAMAISSAVVGMAAEENSDEEKLQPTPPPNSQESHSSGMMYGTIGNVKISRMMLGGNLVSGFMHCRDLQYVPQLFRAYMTEEKIFETFKLCEEHGINTLFESGGEFVKRYNKECGGHMQVIPSVKPDLEQSESKIKDLVKELVDTGAPAMYFWGVAADRFVQAGRVDLIAKTVEIAKNHGLPMGVGGHSLQVPVECEKAQVPCDFYVKTLHTDDYPSVVPMELRKDCGWLSGGPGWYDNMWCLDAEKTVEFMAAVRKPWIAFKILAAGAILPQKAFPYAFRSGADFVAVGMFDFQVKSNCELLNRVLKHLKNRQRPWCA